MAEESEARVYGMADQANRDPAPAEGMRGARSSTEEQRLDPELSHQVMLDNGRAVTVSEGSGTAFAEATGRAGLTADLSDAEPAETGCGNGRPDAVARAASLPIDWAGPVPLFAGLAFALGIVLWAARRRAKSWV